jgi:Mor family transcriptional regulator
LFLRDKSIRDEFTGNNFAELAKKHGITPMRIRQVLAKGRSYSQ